MLDLWYKNAIIYCVDVDSFMDADGDGCGDFKGLADRLDHIASLGVNCIWLLPFYPSPNRDNGYDVTDFYGVHPRNGSLGDFVAFTHAAQDHGMRVIIDLVANHTSIDHPWFQSARSDPKSPYRDWYVWSDERPENADEGVVFPGVQESIWSYDRKAKAWYLHRFYQHQADLNTTNPEVREEIDKIMGFWLQLGVSGFRIDAVPFLIEHLGLKNPPKEDESLYLGDLRRFLSWRKAEAVLLAEANVTMKEVTEYFGPDGNRMHMVFNFFLNQHVFLALARREAEPIRRVMAMAPDLPVEGQWGTFLRNHDELDLGRLTSQERAEICEQMAPDPNMVIYDRGIRRRLAPMLGGDLGRLKLAYSLMFALPGTPVIWYGEEIGMGEDLALKEREAVRTPLQWSDENNGGFSSAPKGKMVRPVLSKGRYGFSSVNIESQVADPNSLLHFIREVIRVRRGSPEIGWGRVEVLECASEVLGLKYEWQQNTLATFHNLSEANVDISIDKLIGKDQRCRVLLASDPTLLGTKRSMRRVGLGPYGYVWLRLNGERR